MNIALSSEEEKGIIWGSEAVMKIQNKIKTLLLKYLTYLILYSIH